MTKYDIKLRRKALTKGQIERHKNFKSMTGRKTELSGNSWVKLALILFASVAIVVVIVMGIVKLSEPPPPQKNVDQEIFEEFKTD